MRAVRPFNHFLMSYSVVKALKQEIGVPGLRIKRSYSRKKNPLQYYLITSHNDFWDGETLSDFVDAYYYYDESEAIEVAKGLDNAKVFLNYGLSSEAVIYET